jgi:hypothetical protein
MHGSTTLRFHVESLFTTSKAERTKPLFPGDARAAPHRTGIRRHASAARDPKEPRAFRAARDRRAGKDGLGLGPRARAATGCCVVVANRRPRGRTARSASRSIRGYLHAPAPSGGAPAPGRAGAGSERGEAAPQAISACLSAWAIGTGAGAARARASVWTGHDGARAGAVDFSLAGRRNPGPGEAAPPPAQSATRP